MSLTDAEFAGFHARTARDLWAFLAATSRDRGLADDLAQETYLRFLQVRVTLAGEEDRRRYSVSHRVEPAPRSLAPAAPFATAHPAG